MNALEADNRAVDILRGVVLNKRLSNLLKLKQVKLPSVRKETGSEGGNTECRPERWSGSLFFEKNEPETLVALIDSTASNGHASIVQRARR